MFVRNGSSARWLKVWLCCCCTASCLLPAWSGLLWFGLMPPNGPRPTTWWHACMHALAVCRLTWRENPPYPRGCFVPESRIRISSSIVTNDLCTEYNAPYSIRVQIVITRTVVPKDYNPSKHYTPPLKSTSMGRMIPLWGQN